MANCLKLSSPSLREIEFTIPFPCKHFRPASITVHLDESTMIGSLEISGSEPIKFRNLVMVASESIIPSSMFTSMICAPPSTCCLAMANAASKSPLKISLENLGEPVMFVLSPTFTKILSGVIVTGSNPLNLKYGSTIGIALGLIFFVFATMQLICSGVVPQQPPTMFTKPAVIKSSKRCAVS